jgi:hypothetical protein
MTTAWPTRLSAAAGRDVTASTTITRQTLIAPLGGRPACPTHFLRRLDVLFLFSWLGRVKMLPMTDYPMINYMMPKTVGQLAGNEVELRCPKCRRIAQIDPRKMVSSGGRSLDYHMPVLKFLARLKCTEKAYGVKPTRLHLKSRTPAGFGAPVSPWRHWTMDAQGNWTFHGEQDE